MYPLHSNVSENTCHVILTITVDIITPIHSSPFPNTCPSPQPRVLASVGVFVNPLTHASFVTHAFFHLFCHISVRIPVSIPAIRSGVADAVLLGLPPSPLSYSKLTAIGVQTPFIATSRSHLVIVTGLPSKWFTTCLCLTFCFPSHSPAFLLPSGSSLTLSHIHPSSYIFDFFCHISVRIPVSIPAIRSAVAGAVLLRLPAPPPP